MKQTFATIESYRASVHCFALTLRADKLETSFIG